MSRRRARPTGLRYLLAAVALLGAASGVGISATHAALSDTEVAATQSITAADCFPKDNPGGGKERGHDCDKKKDGGKPSTTTASAGDDGNQVTTVQDPESATPTSTSRSGPRPE